jgi:putative membrane protein
MDTILSLIVSFLVAAVVIYIVGRLNLGLSVAGYGSAVIAAVVIAIVGAIILWLLDLIGVSVGGGVLGAIVYLVVAAVILLISDRFIGGMQVKGFVGAVVAAVAIAVVSWLINWLLGLF